MTSCLQHESRHIDDSSFFFKRPRVTHALLASLASCLCLLDFKDPFFTTQHAQVIVENMSIMHAITNGVVTVPLAWRDDHLRVPIFKFLVLELDSVGFCHCFHVLD